MTDEREIYAQLKDPKQQRAAFGLVVRQYSEQLYWQIRRIVLTHEDANDVMQNTFLIAWNRLDSFQGESKILTWLSRIAINEVSTSYAGTIILPSVRTTILLSPIHFSLILISMALRWRRCCRRPSPHFPMCSGPSS